MAGRLTRSLSFAGCLTAICAAGIAAQPGPLPDSAASAKFNLSSAALAVAPTISCQIHRNGHLWATINNNGVVGNVFGFGLPESRRTAPSFYYPGYSRIQHGYHAGLWVGGVVGRDTLVSTTIDELFNTEFWPDEYPFGEFEVRTDGSSSSSVDLQTVGEAEFQAIYADTFEQQAFVPYNTYDNRKHRPLNISVVQTSFSWAYEYAQDFVIVDYIIRNIGEDTIRSAFAGIYYNGCIQHQGELPYPQPDDLEGYIYSAPYEFEELGDELMQISYIVDKDGYAGWMGWDFVRSPHTFGIAPLKVPRTAFTNNFNWWISQRGAWNNWAPRMEGSAVYPFRYFYGGFGAPLSDRNRYYLMSKPEIDYSGFEAYIDHTDDGWLPRPSSGFRIAQGHQVKFVTSWGPFNLPPARAETLAVVMAIGRDAHTNPDAYREWFNPRHPAEFLDYLNFDDLISNVRWAKMIYDNPGIDTDGDGDSGKWFLHYDPTTMETLKVFYEGDGVPDLRGASPPPPPPVRIITEEGRLTLRWNGHNTENHIDPMTFVKDFEGYRVYLARSALEQEAVLLASYDLEDYNRYGWNDKHRRYELTEVPFTLDSLRKLYGDSFDPLDYTPSNPLYFNDAVYYFQALDYNASDFLDPVGIHKRYPDAELDTSDVDEESYIRYYEWEYVIENLLPTIPYYVSVTAFDYGHPGKALAPLESSIEGGMVEVMAVRKGEQVLQDGKLNVYCYPNPYRIDDSYYTHGFENRLDETGPERARSIYFANLPNRCTISIYSLDGDLVRKFEHDEPAGSGKASVHRWNVITRNTEAVVSGLYYWVVESTYGNQIGKLVILK